MPKENQDNSLDYIVGIGASAGGLEALQKFFSALPSNTGFPYIIVQHLSPDYKSLLSEILSKYTEMPVVQVEDGMEIERDTVYVIQPGKNMRIKKGKVVLTSQKEHELNLPIDLFFHSLAEEAGRRAIAIILSGTGSDGSNGIRAIKENDGLVLVQDEESAKFDGMPKSALRTGAVDAQFAPEKMALELIHISSTIKKAKEDLINEQIVDEALMKRVYAILKKISNINFTHYKQTTILRRIERRMMLTHKEDLEAYVEYLYENPDEVRTLSKEVLIGVTSFFRDPEFFQMLKEKAVNDIILRSNPDEGIRVWCAGCSTGEEAYSIAMIFCEAMDTLKIKRNVKIFATDLDVESITTAGKGIYGDSIIESVSPLRLSRFFTRQNNSYLVNRELRKMIVFSPHNVFQDPPFGKIDLISCRNMLIYFQPVLQNDLFSIFHTSLKDGGYLFLGKSEAIGAYTDVFPIIDVAAKIFSHKADAKIPGARPIPFLQTTYFEDGMNDDLTEKYRISNGYRTQASEPNENIIDNAILEQFLPASLVVNEKNEVIHSYGDSGNYVHLSLGKFSNILFDVITENLKIPVSTILKEARDKGQKVQYNDLYFVGEKEKTTISIIATPVGKISLNDSGLFAIVFLEKNNNDISDAAPYEVDKIASKRITDLEQELANIQGKLDRSQAEQECVNEELQAANEELLTANEELQSSNEELQSVNEELYTVNSEYQQKLTELADLNDDIANFLASTMIGIIFVDNKLNIRRYTDYVTTEFSVMDHDIGRSLKFISYHFPTVDISEICDNVLKTLLPDEREVTTSKKKVFFMRVAPYRSTENKILGCVITLVDITTQKQGLLKLQSTEERLSLLQQASDARSDYLSRIVEEIKGPLDVILHLSKDLKYAQPENVELDKSIDKITNTVRYIDSIVADISASKQYEELALSEALENFTLKEVTDEVNAIIQDNIVEKDIDFSITVDDVENMSYIGNKIAVEQILVNFLNNSIKYSESEGTITLKIFEQDSEEQRVSLCFSIIDSGEGVSKEHMEEMFIPHEEAGKKSGFALSIAYDLVKSMDGNVSISDEDSDGIALNIVLKLKRGTHSTTRGKRTYSKNSSSDNYDFTGTNVIIAEDNAINRMVLGALLKNANIKYMEAENGEEAVNIFESAKPYTYDCVLMDMRMPIMDGIKATMKIRNSKKVDGASIPIIGVSANGFADDIKQALSSGMNDYTTKPIDRDVLLSLIMKHINK